MMIKPPPLQNKHQNNIPLPREVRVVYRIYSNPLRFIHWYARRSNLPCNFLSIFLSIFFSSKSGSSLLGQILHQYKQIWVQYILINKQHTLQQACMHLHGGCGRTSGRPDVSDARATDRLRFDLFHLRSARRGWSRILFTIKGC